MSSSISERKSNRQNCGNYLLSANTLCPFICHSGLSGIFLWICKRIPDALPLAGMTAWVFMHLYKYAIFEQILPTQTVRIRRSNMSLEKLRRIDETKLEVPVDYKQGMRVPGIIYADSSLERELEIQSIEQVANVATLPGIEKASLAMPDIHTGYGFTIGGVAAFDLKQGIISPGGVGYDIN